MSRSGAPRALLFAVLGGIALGVLSWRLDSLPVDSRAIVLVALGNAAGPWLAAAFAAGMLQRAPRWGALSGALALGTAFVAYYASYELSARLGSGPPLADGAGRYALVWLGVATLAGPLFGAAGAAWAAGTERERSWAVALLAGALLAEAAHRFISVEGWTGIDMTRTALQVAAVDVVAAAVLPLLLSERGSLGVAAGGFVAFAVMMAVEAVLFGRPA
jgi:uncharacterized protein DUF6518